MSLFLFFKEGFGKNNLENRNVKIIDVSSKYNRYVTKFWKALVENSLEYFAEEIDKASIEAENRYENNRVRLFQVIGTCSEDVR